MTKTTRAAKYVVCPECLGEGSFGPGWVWTQDEIDQEDPQEFAELQADLRAGLFNEPCKTCKGQRAVIDVIDYEGVRTTAAERWADERAYRAEVAAEQRFCGVY